MGNHKLKVGITGQSGFIGSHLYQRLKLSCDNYEVVNFSRDFFKNTARLSEWLSHCDVVVHLAAINRHDDLSYLYEVNLLLVNKLVEALNSIEKKPKLIFSSSTHESIDNLYGQSKKDGNLNFLKWAANNDSSYTGLIIPNVFGPFGKPGYNSFISTFCSELAQGRDPVILKDKVVDLIYIDDLIDIIIHEIDQNDSPPKTLEVNSTDRIKVSRVKSLLQEIQDNYFKNGKIPNLSDRITKNLFVTFITYIDFKEFFPKHFESHLDDRGSFVEVARFDSGGQTSFSTTKPGIVRGNHFHTRKFERFAVIEGTAKIAFRNIFSGELFEFILDGNKPSFIDMPVWYTHSIQNIGDRNLLTFFWINEPYNSEDSDTFFLEV